MRGHRQIGEPAVEANPERGQPRSKIRRERMAQKGRKEPHPLAAYAGCLDTQKEPAQTNKHKATM